MDTQQCEPEILHSALISLRGIRSGQMRFLLLQNGTESASQEAAALESSFRHIAIMS